MPGSSVHRILQARSLEWVAFPSAGDLPDLGIDPGSPALQGDSLPPEPPGKSSENSQRHWKQNPPLLHRQPSWLSCSGQESWNHPWLLSLPYTPHQSTGNPVSSGAEQIQNHTTFPAPPGLDTWPLTAIKQPQAASPQCRSTPARTAFQKLTQSLMALLKGPVTPHPRVSGDKPTEPSPCDPPSLCSLLGTLCYSPQWSGCPVTTPGTIACLKRPVYWPFCLEHSFPKQPHGISLTSSTSLENLTSLTSPDTLFIMTAPTLSLFFTPLFPLSPHYISPSKSHTIQLFPLFRFTAFFPHPDCKHHQDRGFGLFLWNWTFLGIAFLWDLNQNWPKNA